jgi:hypothetical protein
MSASQFGHTSQMAQPLMPEYFIQKVLVPKTDLCLISQDLERETHNPVVWQTLEDSRAYGASMFPEKD